MDYDDDLELTHYVWNHFVSLMTDFERLVGKAINGRLKASHAEGATSLLVWTRWGAVVDPRNQRDPSGWLRGVSSTSPYPNAGRIGRQSVH